MPRGKNINLFLMDGDASGRIKCTLANWTGVAYRIPRCLVYLMILERILPISDKLVSERTARESCTA